MLPLLRHGLYQCVELCVGERPLDNGKDVDVTSPGNVVIERQGAVQDHTGNSSSKRPRTTALDALRKPQRVSDRHREGF
jgi:hypothetical protein